MLASGSMDKTTKILKFKNYSEGVEDKSTNGGKLAELETEIHLGSHKGMVRSVKFGNYGRKLLTSGQDQVLKLWDVETGKLMTQLGYEGCYKSNSRHVSPLPNFTILTCLDLLRKDDVQPEADYWSWH